jgi:hypothetical protein
MKISDRAFVGLGGQLLRDGRIGIEGWQNWD